MSTIRGQAIFVVATPESGAERVVRALAALSGVTSTDVPTHLFSQGIGLLLDTWVTRTRDALGDRADDSAFLASVRTLADAPLASRLQTTGADRIVEYSPDHIPLVGPMMTLYPDAHFVHVVRDGREVSSRLSSQLLQWAPFAAARRWCDDQRAVMTLGDQPNLHWVRIEDVVEDPEALMGELSDRLGVDTSPEALAVAAAAIGSPQLGAEHPDRGRTATLVDVLGADVLAFYQYPVREHSTAERVVARASLGPIGEVAWAARGALQRARDARREI
jgi:hypothetical protein